jgi:hypothetical protein
VFFALFVRNPPIFAFFANFLFAILPNLSATAGAHAMKSVMYLEMLKQQAHLKNDAALARALNVGTNTISQYMTGKRIMDDEACLAVAMKLDIDPMLVVAAACIDRAEKAGQQSLWKIFMQRAGHASSATLGVSAFALLASLINFAGIRNAEAAVHVVHAVSSCSTATHARVGCSARGQGAGVVLDAVHDAVLAGQLDG